MAHSAHLSTADRTPGRTRVLFTALIFTQHDVQNVRVQHMSARGARILIDDEIPVGCDAVFKTGALFVAAQVTWSTHGKVGLTFCRELSTLELESALNSIVLNSPREAPGSSV